MQTIHESFPKIKTIISCLILVIISHGVYAQKKITLFQDAYLFGKVKQITEVTYKIKPLPGGNNKTDSMTKSIYRYDTTGNITGRLSYTGFNFGDHKSFATYTYKTTMDSLGNRTETVNRGADKIGIYKLNIGGYPEEFDGYNHGALHFKDIYLHDNHKQLIGDRYYDGSGNLQFDVKFKYDKAGNLVKEEHYLSGGKLQYVINYSYEMFDSNGNWTKKSFSGKFTNGTIIPELITLREFTYY